jgi:hypothetical protein
MFIKIEGPGDAPSELTDWQKISALFQATWLRLNSPLIVDGSTIKRGSAVNVGGQWYVASLDEAITGSASDYVKLTVSGETLTASFASNLSSVSWNDEWSGWYDVSGNNYQFDEVKAFSVGAINRIYSNERFFPSLNWSKGLSRVLSNANLAKLFHPDAAQTLTGSGTYTVGAGVYQITVTLVGPGENGADGYVSTPGDGGASGEEITVTISVTPGQEISYSVTGTSTVFGSTTAAKGAGYLGQKSGSGVPFGGHGGGYKAGEGGGASSNGGNATANYGGGGGGGGSPTSGSTTGGTGATGRIEIT